jgi:uncharacterized protein (TIGR03437 family)
MGFPRFARSFIAALITVGVFGWPIRAQEIPPQWSLAPFTGAVPSPRFDAPIAYDPAGRQLLMFGGQDASADRNDLWSYSVDREQWTQINPSGTPPSPRHGHTVTFDPVRDRIVVIAGQGNDFFGDVWAYDIRTNAWIQLSANSSGPLPRYGHSAVYDSKRDRIVISHGFTSEQGRYDDTWAFDLASNSWRDISPTTRPLRRCLHHAVYVTQSDTMLLYGGCSSGYGPCPQGDLWSFGFAGNQWTQIAPNPSPPPRQRYGMTFDSNRNKVILFGGLGGPVFNDTWEFDPATQSWKQTAPAGALPAPRYRIESAFVPDLSLAFFFGGVTADLTNDLLALAVPPSTPRIAQGGIEDALSGGGGPFAPGEIIAIYGDSLGPFPGVVSAFNPVTALLPTVSGGVSVAVNGIPAPIFYVREDQINVQIPYEVNTQAPASMTVSYNGVPGAPTLVPIAANAPRLYPGIVNQDGTLNSPGNPAAAGSVIVLFATGQGVTNPAAITGAAAAPPYSPPAASVRVTIGGQDATVLFAGLAPLTAGLMQINARLPAGVGPNAAITVNLMVGGVASQQGVTLAVR